VDHITFGEKEEGSQRREKGCGGRLVSVYKAPNELAAVTIRSLLEEQGYPALIRSFQVPMYDSIAMMMRPHWGEVLVPEEVAEEAHEIVNDYLQSLESEPNG
jgi:hypothetical protein